MENNFAAFSPTNLWLLDVIKYLPVFLKNRTSQISEPLYYLSPYYRQEGQYRIFPPNHVYNDPKLQGRNPIIKIPSDLWDNKVCLFPANGHVRLNLWEPERRIVHIDAQDRARLIVATFYYPRWQALLNGSKIEIFADQETGLIAVEIPQGKHLLELQFTFGIYRTWGLAISALSGMIIISLSFFWRRNVSIPPPS